MSHSDDVIVPPHSYPFNCFHAYTSLMSMLSVLQVTVRMCVYEFVHFPLSSSYVLYQSGRPHPQHTDVMAKGGRSFLGLASHACHSTCDDRPQLVRTRDLPPSSFSWPDITHLYPVCNKLPLALQMLRTPQPSAVKWAVSMATSHPLRPSRGQHQNNYLY